MTDTQTPARKGMLLFVYRPADGNDYTNGGISGQVTRLTVTGIRYSYGFDSTTKLTHPKDEITELPRDMQVFAPSENAPEVILVIRDNGIVRWLHLEPATPAPGDQTPYMAGGNLATTSDSRWSELAGQPVEIHDRSDSWALYEQLSK